MSHASIPSAPEAEQGRLGHRGMMQLVTFLNRLYGKGRSDPKHKVL